MQNLKLGFELLFIIYDIVYDMVSMIKSMRASVHAREDNTDTEKETSGNEINNFLWNLEVKIAKIIETGATLGFNFHGKENEIVEVLKRMEQEDDELLKAIVGV
ncbi:hypothetical protein Q3G72_019779 [Acer saccharum]|nr:hypothetical protein Q3G72_019779 [Acer saccharum]